MIKPILEKSNISSSTLFAVECTELKDNNYLKNELVKINVKKVNYLYKKNGTNTCLFHCS